MLANTHFARVNVCVVRYSLEVFDHIYTGHLYRFASEISGGKCLQFRHSFSSLHASTHITVVADAKNWRDAWRSLYRQRGRRLLSGHGKNKESNRRRQIPQIRLHCWSCLGQSGAHSNISCHA